jgi:hypothetical protein
VRKPPGQQWGNRVLRRERSRRVPHHSELAAF